MGLVLTASWGEARVSNRYFGLMHPDHKNVELLCADQEKLITSLFTQQRQRNKPTWLTRNTCCKHTGVNSSAHTRTVQMFSSLWGLQQGQVGTYCTNNSFVNYQKKQIFFSPPENHLSVEFLVTTESQNHMYTFALYSLWPL